MPGGAGKPKMRPSRPRAALEPALGGPGASWTAVDAQNQAQEALGDQKSLWRPWTVLEPALKMISGGLENS